MPRDTYLGVPDQNGIRREFCSVVGKDHTTTRGPFILRATRCRRVDLRKQNTDYAIRIVPLTTWFR